METKARAILAIAGSNAAKKSPVTRASYIRALQTQREKMCNVVASFPASAHDDKIRDELSLVISEIEATFGGGDSRDSILHNVDARTRRGIYDGCTPLMIACDHARPSVLKILLKIRRDHLLKANLDRAVNNAEVVLAVQAKQVVRSSVLCIIGDPLDRSSGSCGGNSAAHFAAHSGCVECLDLLLDDGYSNSTEHDPKTLGGRCSYMEKIVNERNSHGDTPLMMAIEAGHCHFLRHMLTRREGVNQSGGSINVDFSAKNNSGDTALSLAYGHGQDEIVEMLLDSENCMVVSKEDLDRCRSILSQSDSKLRSLDLIQQRPDLLEHPLEQKQNKASTSETEGESSLGKEEAYGRNSTQSSGVECSDQKLEDWTKRREGVKKCVEILEHHFSATVDKAEQIARMMEQEVLAEDSIGKKIGSEATQRGKNKGSKRKKKEKKERLRGQQLQKDPIESIQGRSVEELPINAARFTTLMNGTLVSDKRDFDSQKNDVESPSIVGNESSREQLHAPSLQHMFLERCPEAETLGLDVSTLLLSETEMTVKSVCELDVLERYLTEQLESISQARQIQRRLWQGECAAEGVQQGGNGHAEKNDNSLSNKRRHEIGSNTGMVAWHQEISMNMPDRCRVECARTGLSNAKRDEGECGAIAEASCESCIGESPESPPPPSAASSAEDPEDGVLKHGLQKPAELHEAKSMCGKAASDKEQCCTLNPPLGGIRLSDQPKDTTSPSRMFLDRCPNADSLCLDISMLMVSRHRLAMLSPCQLDALQSFLKDQLRSITRAREMTEIGPAQAERG